MNLIWWIKKRINLAVMFLCFLSLSCGGGKTKPPPDNPHSLWRLDTAWYENVKLSPEDKLLITQYSLRMALEIPKTEKWQLLIHVYSDKEWTSYFGQSGGCGGNNVVGRDTYYNKIIWLGIAYNSERCLKGFSKHPQWKDIDTLQEVNEKIILHEFRCHLFKLVFLEEAEDSCFLG